VSRGRALAGAAVAVLAVAAAVARHDRPPVTPGRWIGAAGLEARHETVNGRRLRLVRAGRGSPVVLVHGFASSAYTWKDVIPTLARTHDVVALDLPGFGGSDQPPDLSFEDLPAAVTGVMDRLSLDRAVLVGNSLGGAAAAVVAGERPERVSALVLVDAAGFNLAPSDRPWVLRALASPPGGLIMALPLKRLVVERSLRQVFHDDALVTEERVAEYLGPLLRPGALASVVSLARSPRRDPAPFAATLARVRAPTLVLWGREDAWIPLAHAELFAAAIPGAETVVLDECGHVPQEEKAAEVARVVGDFVRRAARDPAARAGE